MREVRAHLDVRHLRPVLQVEHRHGPVGLVRHEPLAVAGDRRPVRVAPDLHVAGVLGLGVDDRGAVGEVQRGEQRLPVASHRQVARPRHRLRVGRREVLGDRRADRERALGGNRLRRSRPGWRRDRDHAGARGLAGGAVVVEDVHNVALLAGHARRCALVRVGGVRGAGGIRGLAVGGHRDAAVRARHGDDLHELPNGLDRARVAHGAPLPLELAGPAGAPSPRLDAHDADVVATAAGGEGPEEAPVGRERSAPGVVAELREDARRIELPAVGLDASDRADRVGIAARHRPRDPDRRRERRQQHEERHPPPHHGAHGRSMDRAACHLREKRVSGAAGTGCASSCPSRAPGAVRGPPASPARRG